MQNYISTPDYSEYLTHYGVKGMKWGKRKTGNQSYNQAMAKRTGSSAYNELAKLSDDEYQDLLNRFRLTGGKSSKSSNSSSKSGSPSKASKSVESELKTSKVGSNSDKTIGGVNKTSEVKEVAKRIIDSDYLKRKEEQLNKYNASGIDVNDILERIRQKNRKTREYNKLKK